MITHNGLRMTAPAKECDLRLWFMPSPSYISERHYVIELGCTWTRPGAPSVPLSMCIGEVPKRSSCTVILLPLRSDDPDSSVGTWIEKQESESVRSFFIKI